MLENVEEAGVCDARETVAGEVVILVEPGLELKHFALVFAEVFLHLNNYLYQTNPSQIPAHPTPRLPVPPPLLLPLGAPDPVWPCFGLKRASQDLEARTLNETPDLVKRPLIIININVRIYATIIRLSLIATHIIGSPCSPPRGSPNVQPEYP